MRFRTRKTASNFTRCLQRIAPSLIKTAVCIVLLTCIVDIVRKNNRLADIATDYYLVPKMSFANLDMSELRDNISLTVWRMFQGYPDMAASAAKNPDDPYLLQKLDDAQNLFKLPLFRLKRNGSVIGRHEWKFEKIIHQTWKSEEIPGRTVPWVKKWLEVHPDWTYMFWTDHSARQFIERHFPSLLSAYDSWTVPVQKADMFRYIALYAFGGIYADLDMEVLRNLDDIRGWSSCVLSREPELQTFIMSNFMNCWGNNWTFTCNAFMGCRSHHPFMYYTIARTVQLSPLVRGHACHLNDTIACTGPWMMSFAYGFYRRAVSEKIRTERPSVEVICPEYEWFLPTFDETRLQLVQRNCQQRFKTKKQWEVCNTYKDRGFKNQPLNFSYTTHHWFHSYHYDVNTDRVNINVVTQNLQWRPETESEYFDKTYIGP